MGIPSKEEVHFLCIKTMVVVYGTMTKVLEKLGSIAYEEMSLAWGMSRDLKKLQGTMSTIKAVLLDAEEKQAHNREISAWLANLKEVFLDAEEVLDEFECEALRRKVVKLYGSKSEMIRHLFSYSNPLVFRISLSHKLKETRERLDEVAADRTKFHLSEQREEKHTIRRATHSYVCASEVVGRDVDKENIIHLLMEPCGNLNNVSVIPICGIGGLGKTTLAKLVYNDESVKKHFRLRIWVCISEDFDISRLIKEILSSAADGVHENLTPIDQLQNHLRDKLKDQRFLLILDDVWNDIPDKWFALRELLLEGSKGSKIIVTTRKDSVANLMGTVPTYHLQGLSPGDCLSLLVKWAFKEGSDKQHQNLVNIGKQIVKRCEGVPLAVTTLGSLLHSKLEEQDWKYIRDNEIWKLEQTACHILPALRLSYNELPYYLKPCFHCFSLFPKDYEFKSAELIQLWMAHGVLKSPDENRSTEDIGELYFKEFWARSFFQDVENFNFYYTFRMHDLIHDLAQSMSQSEFSIVNSATKNISERVRHLSVTNGSDELPACLDKLNKVQSIIFPGAGALRTSIVEKYTRKFKSLRMLNLRFSSFETFPSSICRMKHLRFLDLSYNSEMKKLPNSICRLQSLQILKLLGCGNLEGLPRDIRKLISLRFLSVTTTATCFPKNGIECLTSLQTLLIFDCENLISLPKDVGCLSALETLVISGCTKLTMPKDEDDQVNKLSLRRLKLSHLPEMVALPRWLQGCEDTLQFLCLVHCPEIIELPRWLPNIASLKKLEILSCPKLQSLPEGVHRLTALREMKIYGCPELRNFIETRRREDDWLRRIDFDDDPWIPIA